jgi:hypothetical protein
LSRENFKLFPKKSLKIAIFDYRTLTIEIGGGSKKAAFAKKQRQQGIFSDLA